MCFIKNKTARHLSEEKSNISNYKCNLVRSYYPKYIKNSYTSVIKWQPNKKDGKGRFLVSAQTCKENGSCRTQCHSEIRTDRNAESRGWNQLSRGTCYWGQKLVGTLNWWHWQTDGGQMWLVRGLKAPGDPVLEETLALPSGSPTKFSWWQEKNPLLFQAGEGERQSLWDTRAKSFLHRKVLPSNGRELYLTWGKGSKITLAPSGLPVSNKGRKERERKKKRG